MDNRIDLSLIKKIDFTDSAWSVVYNVVDDPNFRKNDSALIFEALMQKISIVSFGDFLKRYIYQKLSPEKNFEDIDDDYYKNVIVESFKERETPAGFYNTSNKLTSLAKNWINQKRVRRETVFLLGFGLGMTADEVNGFLIKAIEEQGIRFEDPFERLCSYSYAHGYSFGRFRMLFDCYKKGVASKAFGDQFTDEDIQLLKKLLKLRSDTPELSEHEKNAVELFKDLFERSKQVAFSLQDDKLMGKLNGRRKNTPQQINESDIERLLCSAVPRSNSGNLTKANISLLSDQLSTMRPSRQRLNRILAGKELPDRFDLITLNFFISSQLQEPSPIERYKSFVADTDALLEKCGFGPMYVVHPYECFLLMCILSDEPLSTYSEVWEHSYKNSTAPEGEEEEK